MQTYFFNYCTVSGHVNPAVSLAMSILGRLPWSRLPVYMLAQYLGALVGSTAIFGVYYGKGELDFQYCKIKKK